jgi:hypothetical protein
MGMINYEDYIKTYFKYDSKTGVITRNDRLKSNGSLDHYGYLIIKIKGKQFKAHRLAWFLYYGYFPKKELDHINHIRNDNRILNLREATRIENIQNNTKKKNKHTNEYGITIDTTKGLKKKFVTAIKGKLFRFYSIEDAKKFRENNINN